MDTSRRDEIISEVPFEIRNAVKPLNNDMAWALFIVILKRDEIRYGEIKEELNIDSSGYVNRYLKALVAAGLIERRAKYLKDFESSERIYYCPTPIGKALIKALYENILIQSPVEKQQGVFTNPNPEYCFRSKEIKRENLYFARNKGSALE